MQELVPPQTTRPQIRPPNVHPVPDDRSTQSGFIILRLRSGLATADGDALIDVARRLRLTGLLSVLESFDLSASRSVRSLRPQQILELERRAASSEFPVSTSAHASRTRSSLLATAEVLS